MADFTLKYDGTADQLVGEDPNGNQIPIPLESLEMSGAITDASDTSHQKLTGALSFPTPTAYSSGPAHGEGSAAFKGATVAPDGRVVFAPSNSSNVGLFDPATDTYSSGPAHGEGGAAFKGATVAPDGQVVFAPSNSSNVGLFDPTTDTYISGPAQGQPDFTFNGVTVTPDRQVVFAPSNSSNVGLVSQLPEFVNASRANR